MAARDTHPVRSTDCACVARGPGCWVSSAPPLGRRHRQRVRGVLGVTVQSPPSDVPAEYVGSVSGDSMPFYPWVVPVSPSCAASEGSEGDTGRGGPADCYQCSITAIPRGTWTIGLGYCAGCLASSLDHLSATLGPCRGVDYPPCPATPQPCSPPQVAPRCRVRDRGCLVPRSPPPPLSLGGCPSANAPSYRPNPCAGQPLFSIPLKKV